jgi:hypothetical protein
MGRKTTIVVVGLSVIYTIDIVLCAMVMSSWAFPGPRWIGVLRGSVVLPFAVMTEEMTTILVSIGLLCIPVSLWILAAIKKSTKLTVAGLITFGLLRNLATFVGCVLTNMD